MNIFSKLSSAFKALPFSGYGGSGHGGGAAYVPGISLTGSGFPGAGLPGTNYDYKSAAGVLWQNPSAAACFVALTKAFAQSRPVLERREGKVWQQVDDHALLDLLSVPNEFYSGERLFGVTLISTMANGAGYWRIERDRKGDPAELWFEPPTGVGPTGIAPAWDEEHFIREYFYFIDGKRHGEPLPRQDVVYFRHGLNPANSREPWAPLSLAAREIATLNSASTYTGALLRNSAVPSGMVTLEGSSLASGTPPTPEQAEEMKRRIKAGFKGDQVGEPFVSSLPWKWTPFNWSPEQLNISKLQTWPQGMVCALLGTPEIVALLPTGEQPTYQNLAASMEWWWNNTVIPLEDAFADEIETQLFPAFGLDRHEYRLTWDRSQVPALQEDEIAKHQMVREDYRAGVIDLYKATVQLGGEAVEEMRGVHHPSAAPKGGSSHNSQETKQTSWFNPELKVYDPNQPRDEDGKWTSGGHHVLGNNFTSKDLQNSSYRYGDWQGTAERFAKQFADAKIENLAAYDSKGNLLCHIIGTETNVGYPTNQATPVRDGLLIHNHPFPPIAFSPADLMVAKRLNLKEMKVATVDSEGIIILSIKRQENSWKLPSRKQLETDHKMAELEATQSPILAPLIRDLQEANSRGDEAALESITNHFQYQRSMLVTELLAKKYGSFTFSTERSRAL